MNEKAGRYAHWIVEQRTKVIVASVVLIGVCSALISKLEVRADFSHLLPPETQSVRHLNALKERVTAFGTVFVVVEHKDPSERANAAQRVAARIAERGGSLIANITLDDRALRRFVWQHRFLYLDQDELSRAADALRERVKRAKLAANPLYIDLEDDVSQEPDGHASDSLTSLRERLAEAKRKANNPQSFVSRDNTLQLVIVRSSFTASEVAKGRHLMAAVDSAVTDTLTDYGSTLAIGVTGNVATTFHEQQSILRGMLVAASVTILLSALALLLFYRSWWAVGAALWSLALGTVFTFGLTELLIGHLNLATAFLAAIVVGNGINPGLMLLARYQEERRAGHRGASVIARSIAGATPGTAAAACTAAVAYASLIVTDFRGFRHFGIIGGIGMICCWLAAFSVLPALLSLLETRGKLPVKSEPALGTWIERLCGGKTNRVIAIALAAAVVSLGATIWYVASDPVEEDWRSLRSTSSTILRARAWNDRISNEFEGSYNQNLSARFAVGLDSPDEVREVRAAFEAANTAAGKHEPLFAYVRTLDTLMPDAQRSKLKRLDEIRELIDRDLQDAADSTEDKALITELRPPNNLRALTVDDVPIELAWPYTEKDGRRGHIVLATASFRYQTWNVRHQVKFASAVRAIPLPDSAIVGGQAFVLADILASMETDGPKATLVALFGSALLVWLVIGAGRHTAATLISAACGILAMIALVCAMNVKINFLDFIALPITVGIGIDYAVNIAARERQAWNRGAKNNILATTGAAVVICSFTTTVGYGSLLLSDNAGIRSFGLAAVLGEIACLAFALTLVPALLRRWRR